jgi:hypothetical protein
VDKTTPPNQATPAAGTPADDGIPPYLLSREYEDYLDWLENQRRSRNTGARRGRFLTLFSSALLSAFAFAGTMMRRR